MRSWNKLFIHHFAIVNNVLFLWQLIIKFVCIILGLCWTEIVMFLYRTALELKRANRKTFASSKNSNNYNWIHLKQQGRKHKHVFNINFIHIYYFMCLLGFCLHSCSMNSGIIDLTINSFIYLTDLQFNS